MVNLVVPPHATLCGDIETDDARGMVVKARLPLTDIDPGRYESLYL